MPFIIISAMEGMAATADGAFRFMYLYAITQTCQYQFPVYTHYFSVLHGYGLRDAVVAVVYYGLFFFF